MPNDEHRPTALIQVDLDSIWAIMSVYGVPVTAEDFLNNPVYTQAMDRFLALFDGYGIKATFFVIGKDCQCAENVAVLKTALQQGHEIANHSMNHRIGLGNLSPGDLQNELLEADKIIEARVGIRPQGFRAPGYDASPAVLQAAKAAGYCYDSSLLPTWVGPFMRFATRVLQKSRAEGAAHGHYGAGSVWKAPREPYYPNLAAPWIPSSSPTGILEIPVTVTPRLRIPIHSSIALLRGEKWIGRTLNTIADSSPVLTYVFHGIDLVDTPCLARLQSGILSKKVFGIELEQKQSAVEKILQNIQARFKTICTKDYAANYSPKSS